MDFVNTHWIGYVPKNAIKRMELKTETAVEKIKAKVSERVLKKHQNQLR